MRGILILALAVVVVAGAAVGLNASVNGDSSERTLSFDLNGGEGNVPDPITVIEGEVVELPDTDASLDHHTFSGWSDGSSVFPAGNAYKVLKSLTLTAVWTPDRYTIVYHLDGGTLPEGSPDSYGYGPEFALPIPVRKGYAFTGWYSDPELTVSTDSVLAGEIGDKQFYASWEPSPVGTGFTMSLTGEIVSKDFFGRVVGRSTVTGSLSFDYVFYEYGKGYYLARTFITHGDSGDSVMKDGYWSDDVSDRSWTLSDDTVIISTAFGEKECYVWTCIGNGYREMQYTGTDDGELYRIVNISTSSSLGMTTTTETDTYDLVEAYTFDASSYYELKVYEDAGISVTGHEGAVTGDRLTLTANVSDGYSFRGWYDDRGRMLSNNPVYIPGQDGYFLDDITVYAENTTEYDQTVTLSGNSRTFTLLSGRSLADAEWTLEGFTGKNNGTGDSFTIDSVGIYTITYSGTTSDGTPVHGRYGVLAAGDYSFSWTYDSNNYTVELTISADDYLAYRNSGISRTQGNDDHMRQFVTSTDPYIISLAHQFETLGASMSERQRADLILSYVQNIPYAYDTDTDNRDEYWSYPLETILRGCGDCEDTSILYCAIAKAMGYDTALMTAYANTVPNTTGAANHCVSLVALSAYDGDATFTIGGKTYSFCETTSVGSSVGENPWASFRNTRGVAV